MDGRDHFERLLGSLHQAVLDDALWPATSNLMDEACGSQGNFLVFGDGVSPPDIEIFFARFCYRGQRREDLERRYFEAYHAVDERIPRLRTLPDSQVVHVSSLYTDDEKKSSVAYNEALPLSRTRNCLNVRLDGPSGSRIVWVVADPIDGVGWSSGRVEMVERLLPHLRQYVRVRQALVNAHALGASFASLLENTRCGVIQLDRRGRIVETNDIARTVLRQGDGLADENGLLRAGFADDDTALQVLLARVLAPFGGQAESGSMTVRCTSGSPRLVVHVNPVGGQWTDLGPDRVAALVLVTDPGNRGKLDPALVGGMLGLTPAESHVAVLLAQGYAVRDIAMATNRGVGTVRWHLKQIFAKHGISRQVELVQLVQSLSGSPH